MQAGLGPAQRIFRLLDRGDVLQTRHGADDLPCGTTERCAGHQHRHVAAAGTVAEEHLFAAHDLPLQGASYRELLPRIGRAIQVPRRVRRDDVGQGPWPRVAKRLVGGAVAHHHSTGRIDHGDPGRQHGQNLLETFALLMALFQAPVQNPGAGEKDDRKQGSDGEHRRTQPTHIGVGKTGRELSEHRPAKFGHWGVGRYQLLSAASMLG